MCTYINECLCLLVCVVHVFRVVSVLDLCFSNKPLLYIRVNNVYTYCYIGNWEVHPLNNQLFDRIVEILAHDNHRL